MSTPFLCNENSYFYTGYELQFTTSVSVETSVYLQVYFGHIRLE